ncbi:hypothetical protein SEA_LYMARA_20 [Arthrobacter phage Lymara]|uniref:Uncharacterized protein n=1 Tax=Arthrobacter phage Lymara TaxID=2599828 RepID=A0A5J6U226_9CAUD|nr:tail assembly chaperone [Arthrobacter phage Lymara]QFG14822.1 hypothetical protein SEA_LYMARA_20 [Arthrobacter phage Lymara]
MSQTTPHEAGRRTERTKQAMTETTPDYGTIPASSGTHAAEAAAATPTPYAYTAKPEPEDREESPLDALLAESKKSLEEFVTWQVDGRDGWAVRFSNVIEPEDTKRYRKSAIGKRKNAEDADQVVAAAMPLIENCRAILRNGKVVVASDGDDLTFGHNQFIEMFGGMGAIHAVRLFLGPGQTLSWGGALFEAAGYGADVTEAVDPHKS